MRSGAVLVLALSACGFKPGLASDGQLPDDAAPDAPDAMIDVAIAPFCDPNDPHVMACYELDGNTDDGSPHHLNATPSNVSYAAGHAGGMAMLFGPTSIARVADSQVLDLRSLTIEAWIQPSQLPLSGRSGILDVDPQYGLFVYPDNSLHCILGGGPITIGSSSAIAAGRWTHVACTYDGAALTVYVDGSAVQSMTSNYIPLTTGNSGLSIAANNPDDADRLIGLIDQVRLMDVARSPSEICADAGKTSCP